MPAGHVPTAPNGATTVESSLTGFAGLMAEAAFDPSATEPALQCLAGLVGVPFAELWITNARSEILNAARFGPFPDDVARREAQYHALNPRVRSIPRYVPGRAVRDQDIIAISDIASNAAYQEFILPVGAGYFCAVALENSADAFAAIIVHQKMSSGVFDDRQAGLMEQAARAGQSAYDLSKRVAKTNVRSVLDCLDEALAGAVVDARAGLCDHNAAFDELLERGVVRVRADRTLDLKDVSANRQLKKAVRVGAAGKRRFPVRSGEPEDVWICEVLQKPSLGLPTSVAGTAILVLEEFSRTPQLDVRLVREMFSLTEAEADIATRLFQGQPICEIAEARGVSQGTVRGMVKTIFAKTDCNRQPQLVSKLAHLI